MHRILSNEVLAPDVHRLWVEAPHVIRKRRPGQFVIVRASEDGERIPLTIADVDPARGAIALVIQGVGKTTMFINELPAGASLLDVVGPLGRPTRIEPGSRVCWLLLEANGLAAPPQLSGAEVQLEGAEAHSARRRGRRDEGQLPARARRLSRCEHGTPPSGWTPSGNGHLRNAGLPLVTSTTPPAGTFPRTRAPDRRLTRL